MAEVVRGHPVLRRREVKETGGKIITTKWVDADKGLGGYRSRLVGGEMKQDKRQDLF